MKTYMPFLWHERAFFLYDSLASTVGIVDIQNKEYITDLNTMISLVSQRK